MSLEIKSRVVRIACDLSIVWKPARLMQLDDAQRPRAQTSRKDLVDHVTQDLGLQVPKRGERRAAAGLPERRR